MEKDSGCRQRVGEYCRVSHFRTYSEDPECEEIGPLGGFNATVWWAAACMCRIKSQAMTPTEVRYVWPDKISWVCRCMGRVIAETDHKPLISIAEKDFNDMTPKIQRMMMRLKRYGRSYMGVQAWNKPGVSRLSVKILLTVSSWRRPWDGERKTCKNCDRVKDVGRKKKINSRSYHEPKMWCWALL